MSDVNTDLGTCCICGGKNRVRNVIQLEQKSPTPGCGWGCIICELPPDGAVSVVCDECLDSQEKLMHAGERLLYACKGFPATGGRVPIGELRGEHKHDMSKHRERGSGQQCRVCGCTDSHACATPSGQCYWVEWDLCSACAAKEEGEDLEAVVISRPDGLHLTESDVATLDQFLCR